VASAGAGAIALAAALSASQDATGMFRGGPAHTGVYHTTGVERLGGIQWRFQAGGMVQSSPALGDGLLYVGSGDGHLYALDPVTGEERWRFFGGRAITSSPAVAEGLVFFGSRDIAFYAVDARSGARRWKLAIGGDAPLTWGYESGDLYTSSPAFTEGTVVFGSGDGQVYAVDAGSGKVRWRFASGGRVRSSPAVAGGRVYLGSMDGTIYAPELAGGNPVSRHNTEGHDLNSAQFGFDRRTIQSSPGGGRPGLRRLARRVPVRARRRDRLAAVAGRPPDVVGQYHTGGGRRVVWPGVPPMLWPRDPRTSEFADYSGIDHAAPLRLLEVDHARGNFDGFGAVCTPEGARWGLTGWWEANWSVDPKGVTEALAALRHRLRPDLWRGLERRQPQRELRDGSGGGGIHAGRAVRR